MTFIVSLNERKEIFIKLKVFFLSLSLDIYTISSLLSVINVKITFLTNCDTSASVDKTILKQLLPLRR
jgi:hypothetical protein